MRARGWRPTTGLFALAALLYALAVWLLLPPAPGRIDSAYFKEAGINLAEGRGFTAAFNFGSPGPEPRLYAGYMPGLPLLYAGYVALAGVGPAQNALFELLIEGLVAVLVHLLLWRALGRPEDRTGWALFAILLLALPGRYVFGLPDRPDAPALACALLALLPSPARPRAVLAAGLLAGGALLLSFVAGALAAAGVALRWLLLPADARPGLAGTAALGLAGLLTPAGLALAALTAADATYPGRLLGFVGAHLVVPGGGLEGGGWWRLFAGGADELFFWMDRARPAILLALACLLLRKRPGMPASRGTRPALALIWLATLACLVVVPWNTGYGALAAGLLLPALAVALPRATWRRPGPRRLLLAALLALVLARLPLEGYLRLAQAGLGESLARMRATLAAVEWRDRDGDGQVWIAADPRLYFLLRPLARPEAGIRLANLFPPRPDPAVFPAILDYVVLGYGPGGGALEPLTPRFLRRERADFALLYRPPLPQYVTLLGWRLSNSAHSWEGEIWARR